MNRSELINELVTALARAQSNFDPVLKDSTNPHYRSKYADMASVIRATQAALCAEGLVIIQFLITDVEKKQAGVSTTIAHKSGQFIESSYMLPALMQGNRFDAQSCGSAFTYSRRYAYQAAIGVAGEDDDGSAAVGSGSKEAAQEVAKQKVAEAKQKPKAADTQLVEAKKVIISRKNADNGHFIVVSGLLEPLSQFFADTGAQRFKSASDGLPYYKLASEYEKDLLKACEVLGIEVE